MPPTVVVIVRRDGREAEAAGEERARVGVRPRDDAHHRDGVDRVRSTAAVASASAPRAALGEQVDGLERGGRVVEPLLGLARRRR